MKNSDFFYNLNPFNLMESLENLGFRPEGSCQQLNSLENRVYDIKLEDNSNIIVKYYRPGRWNYDQIIEEHKFVSLLLQDEIPVCAPLKKNSKTLFSLDSLYYAVWDRTGGRQLDEFSDDTLKMMGRLIGRIHQSGKKIEYNQRPLMNCKYFTEQTLLQISKNNETVSSIKDEYIAIVNDFIKLYKNRSEGVPIQTIHGDCHIGNLLFNGDKLFFLDFDDTVTGPIVQDLWMILGGDDTDYLRRCNLVLEGYRTFCDFKESWLSLIEPLRAMRMIYWAGWVTKRAQDPAFKKAFPQIYEQNFWQNELKDLKRQWERCLNDKLANDSFTKKKAESELLSNSDYFYDM